MPRTAAADRALRRAARPDQASSEVRRTSLPGGLRVVTERVPSVHSVSVGLWVGVGSRDEGASVAGAAHFGFRAVWLNRARAPAERLPARPALEIRSLAELSAALPA